MCGIRPQLAIGKYIKNKFIIKNNITFFASDWDDGLVGEVGLMY